MALDKFIYRLQNDEDIHRQKLLRQEFLPAEPLRQRRKKRYLADKHLLTLAQRYVPHYRANGNILRYLRCVQHHLQKPRFPGEPANVNEDPLEEVGDDEEGGNDGAAGVLQEADGDRIPRRESHPGRVRNGLELEEEEDDGVQVMHVVGAAEQEDVRHANVDDDPLPGFSQVDVVARSQPPVHCGPVQLPSQPSSAATSSAFIRRPSAAAASRRGPDHLATFNALMGYGTR